MSHRKKPGAPGRTTIPAEVVAEVTGRLLAEFRKMGYARYHRLFVVSPLIYTVPPLGGSLVRNTIRGCAKQVDRWFRFARTAAWITAGARAFAAPAAP